MIEMAKAPKKWLDAAKKLVDERGTANYKAVAEILFDLRESVGGKKGDSIARQHAARRAPRIGNTRPSIT